MSFKTGILQGYQTMDLLAAFFFSTFVIRHLQNDPSIQKNPQQTLPIFFKSSLLGAGLLSSIYCSLVLLGSMYAPQLASIPPEEMLGFVANQALGQWGAPIVCVAVMLACLTTAIVLTSLFADFLRKEVSKNQISSWLALSTTLLIAFFTSTLEFSGISKILGPILEVTYPALIVLTILSIFHKLWGWQSIQLPIVVTFALKLLSRFV